MWRLQTRTQFETQFLKKRQFVASVYMLLFLQIALTTIVAVYLRRHPLLYAKVRRYFWLWFVVSLLLILSLSLSHSHAFPLPIRFGILCVFSLVMGLNCIAASSQIDGEAIKAALFATMGLFVLMSLAGLGLGSMGIHMGFMSYILLCSLLALLVVFITLLFVPVPSWLYKIVLACGIVLFSVFIAYDTNVMIQKDYDGDVVSATINLYLDTINIFTELVAFDRH